MSPTIRTRVWRNGTIEAEDFPIERVSDYLAEPDAVVWADILHPDDKILATLADELSLDPHAVEDALGANERPKVIRYPTHFFLTAYTVTDDKATISLGRVSCFAVKRGLVTVRLDDSLDIDSVTKRWEDDADLIKLGSLSLVYGLLDELVDRYLDATDGLDRALEGIEDILFADDPSSSREVSRQTFECRRAMQQLRRAVLPMREIVSPIMHRVGDLQDAQELMPYYQDLYDHALHAAEWTESMRDTIASIFDTNTTLNDSRMNAVMKQLTAWAAIIAVPTAVTGYFGQNLPYPGYEKTSGFWLSVIVILGVAGALYVTFKRKDWL